MSLLPPEMTVIERGWLSANTIVFTDGPAGTAVVDTGYCTHAAQTVALVVQALQGRVLERILNTHLHSDHCGGNAALQQHWPQVQTAIAPGLALAVGHWDAHALSYTPTGQDCPPFRHDALLQPGTEVKLGHQAWQIHAAPGHDSHAILLFEPQQRILISGDALWENGFGVVFPELDGEAAFADVAATLDLIDNLAPAIVVPGHGAMFQDTPRAIDTARRRLDSWARDPVKHARHAAKVLLKYKLLEWQQIALEDLQHWFASTPYFGQLHAAYFANVPLQTWCHTLIDDLVRSGAAHQHGQSLHNV
ncbi:MULTISPECIES: MBL fold metallo-hydrolase [Giesbergeria]|uniref:MBL fold metallo-hydrolase n=1 Tax=Giesbergeria sinuosa TaxID=80883 RepID=A0ABV9Q9G1_9BURK